MSDEKEVEAERAIREVPQPEPLTGQDGEFKPLDENTIAAAISAKANVQ